eukprot:6071579-Amphidinium_carterae.1
MVERPEVRIIPLDQTANECGVKLINFGFRGFTRAVGSAWVPQSQGREFDPHSSWACVDLASMIQNSGAQRKMT